MSSTSNQPQREPQIDALARDLFAPESLAAMLAAGFCDRQPVQCTVQERMQQPRALVIRAPDADGPDGEAVPPGDGVRT